MQEFISPILYRVQNLFTVLSNELQHINSENIINLALNGGVVFAFFFFISRFFRAYILRLGFFIFGAWVLWQVSARDSILQSFDFYGGLGMILPQLEIPMLTFLIIKYRVLYIYERVAELISILFSPLVWLYQHLIRFIEFIKAKQEERADKKAYEKYYHEEFYNEFKQQQKAEWEKEQERQDEQAHREFREREQKRKQKKQEQNKEYEEQKKQYQEETKQKQEKKTTSRWDSNSDYVILDINENATKQEIKKAYITLAKIYHPDLALLNKEEAEEIFKRINRAYENLG